MLYRLWTIDGDDDLNLYATTQTIWQMRQFLRYLRRWYSDASLLLERE